MPVIGLAEVLVKPSFKGMQQSIGRELSGLDSKGAKAGRDIGGGVASGIKAATGIIGGAIAAVGIASFVSEAAKASDATDKFKATMNFAGIDTSGVEKATKAAKAYADQTVYDLPTIQNTLAQLASNGVKDYTGLTKAAGNLNAVAGGNADTFKSVAMVMTQTAGAGKLTTENWNQLADAIPGAAGPLMKALEKAGAYTGNFRTAMEKGQISSDEFNAALLKLGTKPVAVEAAKSTKTFEGAVGNLQATINGGLMTALDAIKPGVTGAVSALSDGLGKAMKWAGDGISGLYDLIVNGNFSGKLRDAFGVEEDSGFVTFIQNARTAVMNFASYVQTDLIPRLQDFGKWVVDNKDWLGALAISVGAMVVGMKLWTGAIELWKTITTTAAAVQLAFNAAMTANPIGLIVMGIAALVAGLIYFFTQTELGQQIVANVWSFIQTAVGAVVTWFQTYVLPTVLAIFNGVGAVFSWLYTNIIQPVWNGIMVVVNAAWLVIRGIFQVLVSVLQNVVAPAFQWLYNNIIKPVFDAIGAAIGWVWNNVLKPIFDTWVWIFRNVVGPAFNWLYQNVIKPAFDGIGSAIKWVWDNVLKPVFDFLSNAIQKDIPKAFDTGVAAVKKVWETIQDIAKAPVRFVVDTVINDGLIGAFNTIAGILPGIDKLPRVALPEGFATGGYTGDGGRDEPMGVVHGGEFVLTKAQTRKAGVANLYALAKSLDGYADGGFVNPLKSLALTQGYNRVHKGVDFAAGVGTPVFATENGRVSWSGPGVKSGNVWGGNEIHIDGQSGIQEWFAHLSQMAVKVGDMVRAGQQIGLSGNTGITSGPHLHFGTFAGGWPNDVNPLNYLSGAGVPSGGGFNPLAGIIDGLLSTFRDAFPAGGFIADMAIGVGKKLFSGVTDLITGGHGSAAGPALYDLGGVLPPGVSQVVNRTGKPEAILNPQQWADISRLATQGGGVELSGAVRLVVDGHEFGAYVDNRAGSVVSRVDNNSQYMRTGRR